ncbi:hypothetical protein HDV00_000647, partial [Rhizophlyctis rosea]
MAKGGEGITPPSPTLSDKHPLDSPSSSSSSSASWFQGWGASPRRARSLRNQGMRGGESPDRERELYVMRDDEGVTDGGRVPRHVGDGVGMLRRGVSSPGMLDTEPIQPSSLPHDPPQPPPHRPTSPSPPPSQTWTTDNILLGLSLAYTGAHTTLTSPRTRTLLLRTTLYLLLVTLLLYTLAHLFFLPLRITHFLITSFIRPFFGPRVAGVLDWLMDGIDRGIRWVSFATPEAGLYFVRYAWPWPLDKVFFEALRGWCLVNSLPVGKTRFVMRFARSLDGGGGGGGVGKENGRENGGEEEGGKGDRLVKRMSRVGAKVKDSISTFNAAEGWSALASIASETDGEGLRGLSASSPSTPTCPTPPPGRSPPLTRLTSYLNRYTRRLFLLLLITLASYIPLIGTFAWPLATFTYLGLAIGFTRAAY